MENLLEQLNRITDAWKAQFGGSQGRTAWARAEASAGKPDLPLVWSIRDGVLFLDGIWVAPARFVDAAKLDTCARQVQPANITINLIDGSLDIIIIREFGEYRIHCIERHI